VLQELRDVALACCRTAEVLHKVDIVHSDFRSSNVVRLDATHWMVIDLENCRRPSEPLPVGFSLRDWNAGTLEGDDEKGCLYTTASDMYQIGVMLFSSLTACSPTARNFVNELLRKKLTASEALQHPWLAQPCAV
jgi:serine/threonine protein kinase